MPKSPAASEVWLELNYADWKDTCATLHMWTQIVGKIRLTLTPWTNHSWHVTLYVTARGLTTSPIPHGNSTFEIDFDFIDHQLRILKSDGGRRSLELKPRTVAAFYKAVMTALDELGLPVKTDVMPMAIFYSYAYPEPAGFPEAKVKPGAASYNAQFHEFVLPYDAVRTSKSPDDAILDFAQSTYDAASTLSNWDRGALEERKPSLHLARQHS